MARKSVPKKRNVLTQKGDPIELKIPNVNQGIGAVITSPNSDQLIAGVTVESFPTFADDRGHFLEVMRAGQGLHSEFSAETTQVSTVLSYPGTIKAFHYHVHQTDLWVPAQGMFQVALVDLRVESKSFGWCNTMYVGVLRPWKILIPPGVGHGYKIIGTQSGVMVYVTDRFYNPKDEGRIAHNEPGIGYDWEIQHK